MARADDASVYGLYALPVPSPAWSTCEVCGGPAAFARVHLEETVDAWCGPECAVGRRAGELRVGEHVAVWASRFPEVEVWPDRRGDVGREVWPFRGFARLAVVSSVTDDEVTLTNPGGARAGTTPHARRGSDDHGRPAAGRQDADPRDPEANDPPERIVVPADYPCTRFTGITVRRPRRRRRRTRPGVVVWRWPVDAPWVREVTFGHWVSHQPQGLCEDSPECEEPATLWVSYGRGLPDATDLPSCERCLARRLLRRPEVTVTGDQVAAAPGHGFVPRRPTPTPVAYWNPALDAWDVRRHDGSPTSLA